MTLFWKAVTSGLVDILQCFGGRFLLSSRGVYTELQTCLLQFDFLVYRAIFNTTMANKATNRELEEMSKGENIVKLIKGQRISWLGHLERMEEDRMPKKFLPKNWKRRDEGEDPGKEGKRK